ncbi:MAG: helix-turn-helix domain-containing protein [Corynebacterium sp.]|uniref:AlbA family DNA-binding domain-containing protein n=1 Tax=Corynebacterium sp. TaxID=1720 RepID=UPI003F115C3E
MFTSLHRALGIGPTDTFTTEMLDELVDVRAVETADLDFKAKLDSHPTAPHSDVKKDLAAMANYGGGVIVYGIGEKTDKKDHAGVREDVGLVDEGYEQAYMSVAVGHIVPPLFGVELHPVVDDERNALVVVVPRSRQVPHMFFTERKNSPRSLSVPVRHGAHSEWLSESEIARLYRERFDGQRESAEALEEQYTRVMDLRGDDGYWMAGVARPTRQTVVGKAGPVEMRTIAFNAHGDTLRREYDGAHSALIAVNRAVRPGFRSWRFAADGKTTGAPEFYVEFHDNGGVSVLCRLDVEHGKTDDAAVYTYRMPTVVGDLLACLRHFSGWTGSREYDVLFGVEWTGDESLTLKQEPDMRFLSESVVPIRRFVPVEATVDVAGDDAELRETARGLALDCLNQAGVSQLTVFR